MTGLNTPTPAPSVVTPTPGASPEATASPSPSPAGAMRVQLTAPVEEVWLKVKSDDSEAEQMLLQRGGSREFDVSEEIILSIGRVQSLKIAIDGRNMNFVKLLPNPKATRASNFVLNNGDYQKGNYQQYLN